MHRQQKTFTPSSFILPLAVTALVIFLASQANAQNTDTEVDLPPSLESLDAPAEARLAPINLDDLATGTPPEEPAALPMNRAAVDVNVSVGNASSSINQNVRADLSSKRTEWTTALLERRDMLERKRAELASSTLARKAALNAEAQARMGQLAEKSASTLLGALTRIKNISSNLRDRAESMSSRGVDTTEAMVLLDQADDLISQAESSLSDIDINIEYALTSETPKETWADARIQFQTTAEIIRTIRPLLHEVVTALREAIRNTENTSVEPI